MSSGPSYDPDASPRVSGSLGRWPFFLEVAVALSETCNRRALKLRKPGPEVSMAHSRRLEAIAKEANALEDAFRSWELGDPGQELRTAAVTRLLDLRAEAQDMGVDIMAAIERHG